MSPAIDPGFRPADYWDPTDPLALIIANIKGAQRKAGVRRALVGDGEASDIAEHLLADTLTGSALDEWTRQGPNCLGGELLPDYLPGELEICRIVLRTERLDVVSLRARRRGGRIHYRMVDERETCYCLHWPTSEHPLTMRELTMLIDGAALVTDGGKIPALRAIWDRLREGRSGWITFVESPFYPELETLYHQREASYLQLAWQDREVAARDPGERIITVSQAPLEVQDAIDDLVGAFHWRRELDAGQLALVTRWLDTSPDAFQMDYGEARVGCHLEREAECFSDDDLRDHLNIEDGDPIDDGARLAYARGHLLSIMDGNQDADVHPAFGTIRLASRAGQSVVLGTSVSGYSFSGVEEKRHGLFLDAPTFHRWLRGEGWLTCGEDVEALADAAILACWVR